jgi:hypothetical protein
MNGISYNNFPTCQPAPFRRSYISTDTDAIVTSQKWPAQKRTVWSDDDDDDPDVVGHWIPMI